MVYEYVYFEMSYCNSKRISVTPRSVGILTLWVAVTYRRGYFIYVSFSTHKRQRKKTRAQTQLWKNTKKKQQYVIIFIFFLPTPRRKKNKTVRIEKASRQND